jgi:chromosome partitioning protein
MAKTLGCINKKGGVGKTTTNKHMAEFSAIVKKESTLVIGMDPQMDIDSAYLNIEKNPISGLSQPPIHPIYNELTPEQKSGWDGRSSSADIFIGNNPNQKIIPYPTRYENLDILPANSHKLSQLETIKDKKIIEKITLQLCAFLSQPAIQKAYKLIVIDCPPTHGILTASTLNALTHLVIPIELEKYSIRGVEEMITIWYQNSLSRPEERPLKLIGIFPNKVHPTRSSAKQILKDLRNHPKIGKRIFPEPIQVRNLKEFPDVEWYGIKEKSLFLYPESVQAKQDMINACNYIYREIFDA